MDRSGPLREGVRRAYSAAAERPEADHPSSPGRLFAEGLGYPPALLAELPPIPVDSINA